MSEPTAADRVWQECRRGAAHAAAEQEASRWPTRDILVAATQSFAQHWDTTFGPFDIWDPDDVKELARWQRIWLQACGRAATS